MSESPSIPLRKPLLPNLGRISAYLLLAVLIAIGGWQGFRFAKLRLSLSRARREFSNRQFMRAEFWAGRALGVEEKNLEATRLMAEINEAQDKPAGLGWRIKMAQREPGDPANLMAWAKSAMRFGEGDMALKALDSLPQDFKERSAEYHELMAGFALASHQFGLAEANFIKAAELDRENPVHRSNLAAFRLTNSPTPEVRAAAARDLERLMEDPRARLPAVRALLVDAIRNRDRVRAQRFAEKLRSIPEHSFGDDLSSLEGETSEAAFRSALKEVEHRAESNSSWTTEAVDWLNAHAMAVESLRWFAQLPETIQSSTRVQIAVSESHLATGDWQGLATFLTKRHWDIGEYLRRALLIRCHRELSLPWEQEWKQLMAEVDAKPPEGLLLAHLVAGWNWRNEALILLWGAASRPETGSKALQDLWDLYSRTNETSELLRVAKAQLDLDPSNPAHKNNVAFLSLLQYGASKRSEDLAKEASTANPNVPEWSATYAYALHLAGKEEDARKTMESLSPEMLKRPGIALYDAIVLAGNGEFGRAKECLEKLNPKGMLPEEIKLASDLAQRLKATVQ